MVLGKFRALFSQKDIAKLFWNETISFNTRANLPQLFHWISAPPVRIFRFPSYFLSHPCDMWTDDVCATTYKLYSYNYRMLVAIYQWKRSQNVIHVCRYLLRISVYPSSERVLRMLLHYCRNPFINKHAVLPFICCSLLTRCMVVIRRNDCVTVIVTQ